MLQHLSQFLIKLLHIFAQLPLCFSLTIYFTVFGLNIQEDFLSPIIVFIEDVCDFVPIFFFNYEWVAVRKFVFNFIPANKSLAITCFT